MGWFWYYMIVWGYGDDEWGLKSNIILGIEEIGRIKIEEVLFIFILDFFYRVFIYFLLKIFVVKIMDFECIY